MTTQRAVKTPREGTNVTVYLVTAKWTASVEVNMLIPLILMSTVICQISRTQACKSKAIKKSVNCVI